MKTTMFAVALLVSFGASAFAQQEKGKGEAKKEMKQEQKQEKKQEGRQEKLRTLTGLVESVDAEKGTVTARSMKFKDEVMTFAVAGLKLKDGDKEVDASALKPGDRIKLRYEGDIKAPVIKQGMMLKEDEGKEDKKEGEKKDKKEKKEKREGGKK